MKVLSSLIFASYATLAIMAEDKQLHEVRGAPLMKTFYLGDVEVEQLMVSESHTVATMVETDDQINKILNIAKKDIDDLTPDDLPAFVLSLSLDNYQGQTKRLHDENALVHKVMFDDKLDAQDLLDASADGIVSLEVVVPMEYEKVLESIETTNSNDVKKTLLKFARINEDESSRSNIRGNRLLDYTNGPCKDMRLSVIRCGSCWA